MAVRRRFKRRGDGPDPDSRDVQVRHERHGQRAAQRDHDGFRVVRPRLLRAWKTVLQQRRRRAHRPVDEAGDQTVGRGGQEVR